LILPDNIKEGIINPRLIKISLNKSKYDNKFFKYYLESSTVKSIYTINASGTTMDVLNIGIINKIPFPLPPTLVEQFTIVREIESRLSVCDKVEQSITEALEKADALRQSILKKAFEGKLLSEAEIAKCKKEADYEPASKLLEKIKAGR
jgi:type I restriction enzyme S subunit